MRKLFPSLSQEQKLLSPPSHIMYFLVPRKQRMDISKHSKNNNNGSKITMKLLLSLSAFSLIISYSSLIFPFLINSLLNVCVAAFYNQSFSSALEKNCAFLLCNGLLMIIFKNSGLIGQSPEQLDTNNSGIVLHSTSPEKASQLALQQVVLEDDRNEDHEDEKEGRDVNDLQLGKLLVTSGLEKEEELEEEVSLDEESEREVEKGIIIFEDYNESYEEEGTIGLPSTEEFNKKCEDFIRRVREEIKCGAR